MLPCGITAYIASVAENSGDHLYACAVRMREQFETYSDGLFALPLDIPGTPYGKAIKARKIISADIESRAALPARHHDQLCRSTLAL